MVKLKTVKESNGVYKLMRGKEVISSFVQVLGGNYTGEVNGMKVTATTLKTIVSMSELALNK